MPKVCVRRMVLVSLALAAPWPAAGFEVRSKQDLAALEAAIFANVFITPELDVQPSLVIWPAGSPRALARPELAGFFARHSYDWEVRWDTRGDRPNLIQGVGVPLLPSEANRLTAAEAGLIGSVPKLVDVERAARRFMASFPELFRIGKDQLVLRREGSIRVGDSWLLELQQVHQGVPVEGAVVFFRINNGNLIQFGAERVAPVAIDAKPKLTREDAFAAVLAGTGVALEALTEVVEAGKLKFVPLSAPGDRLAELYAGAAGAGYRHALVWEIAFRRGGDPATWQAWVDAKSGTVLQVLDKNAYAQVSGGVYPTTNTDPETVVPFPFTNVTNGSAKVTDAAGNYTYSGGTATATLNGKYIRMADNCGSISLSNASTGDLAFGTSGGTDCTTPGVGGAGNTHASRTGYFHLTNINRKAATFLPTNTWLAGTLTANMNINQTCNAFWNGSTVNFYRSGGGCSNTGEIAAVFLHEWGHGMDSKSGGAASDQGTGEAVGDTFAFLETKNPCIGPNFKPGVPCTNCTTCTGVRDVSVFAAGGPRTIAKPSTVADNNGINCDRFTCPYRVLLISPYQGPMGYEGHCESYIASGANWDLAQLLIGRYGTAAGWAAMDSIWYESLTPSKSAYRLVSGGKCNPAAVVDGCGSSNWYTVFLAVDDDDGNLANGTPNGCRIWDAFSAHGIACGARPACTL